MYAVAVGFRDDDGAAGIDRQNAFHGDAMFGVTRDLYRS